MSPSEMDRIERLGSVAIRARLRALAAERRRVARLGSADAIAAA